jgi:type VI secretion system protein ImpD/type VI secretion system protein ImpC
LEAAPAITAPAPHDAVAPGPGLREAVLAGRFFGSGCREAAAALADFLVTEPRGALARWLGPDRVASADDVLSFLDRDVAALDAMIADQIDAILHAHRLQRLEATWRGIDWLVHGIEPGARVKVRLLNIGWAELCRDLDRAAEFDQSQLFRRIYEDEFGTPGGEPLGLLVIDHEVRHRPAPDAPTDDVTALRLLAAVVAAAFVPTVLGAAPSLLGVDGFGDLSGVNDITAPFRGPDYTRWRGLAAQEDVRFLAVVLPRVLARPPWPDDPVRGERFRYREYAPTAADRVWMNAGYAFAAIVARAMTAFGWPADVRGMEPDQSRGGLVEHMPLEPFETDPDLVWVRSSLQVVLTDRQEQALVSVGLMPLSALPFSLEALFDAVPSLQAPQATSKGGATDTATAANVRISAQLNSMLCASRFAHFLKVLGRDLVGAFQTADVIEARLQTWISGYVNTNITAGPALRARHPLKAARVSVAERPDRPGVFGCIVHLQPHHQLDDVSATFRLVTDIAQPGAAR